MVLLAELVDPCGPAEAVGPALAELRQPGRQVGVQVVRVLLVPEPVLSLPEEAVEVVRGPVPLLGVTGPAGR